MGFMASSIQVRVYVCKLCIIDVIVFIRKRLGFEPEAISDGNSYDKVRSC